MTITVDVSDALYQNTEDEKLWFENEVLVGDRSLLLHSNEIGDVVGEITSVSNIQYIDIPCQHDWYYSGTVNAEFCNKCNVSRDC